MQLEDQIKVRHKSFIQFVSHALLGSFQFNDGDDSTSVPESSASNAEVSDTDSVIEVDQDGLTQEQKDKADLGALFSFHRARVLTYASEKLKKSSTSHIYAFYSGDVGIEYRDGKLHHIFTCAARSCKQTVARNQQSKDASSTKNLTRHAKKCWGEDNIKAAADVKDLAEARRLLKANSGLKNQRLTDIFKQHASDTGESFSHVPLTREESRAEHVRWVSESLRPFAIVKDRAYRKLMKSGRPTAYIPSPSTVARDVKTLFQKTRDRLKNRFKKILACISLATDAWSSPNHYAYVAVSGHWEEDGRRMNCLLDFVEVPKVFLFFVALSLCQQFFAVSRWYQPCAGYSNGRTGLRHRW
ncbi:hypothetical protein C8R45DRAFT_837606 [Mycena sanguinolenta]|nr:hypothetical protein C8R45DRAFT_837606 [Mycena sanguinolenta]